MKEFLEHEIIDNIDNAIVLLKNLKVLYSSKTYFVLKKGKVLIIGLNSKYFLSFEEFKELYKESSEPIGSELLSCLTVF
jgi:hypothetical protein